MHDTNVITDAIRDGKFGPAREIERYGAFDNETRYALRALTDALAEVAAQANSLLTDLRSDDVGLVYNAVYRIADGAGASGPIHSQYAKAIANAAKIQGLVTGFRSGSTDA